MSAFRLFGAGVGAADPPCSNTGEIQSCEVAATRAVPAALVDFLSVSILRTNFRQPGGPVIHELPKDDAALKRAMSTTPGLARIYFRDLFPGTSLTVEAFTDKAFQGYRYSADICAPGVDGAVGKVAVGGNGNTVFISLTGSGCAFLHDLKRYALTLEAWGARITRVDCAVDDIAGEFLDVRALATLAAAGGFKGRGGLPAMRFVDDLGTGQGSTLYVGQKGAKELCIYEKGLQLGQAGSVWVRAEVRLWSKNRKIPYGVLLDPGAFVVGEYPALAPFLPIEGAKRSQVMKAQSEATLEAATRWMQCAGGKTLNVLRRAADRADLHPMDLILSLTREGTPRRFKGQPEAVMLHWAEKKVRHQPEAVFDLAEVERDEFGAKVAVGEWHG